VAGLISPAAISALIHTHVWGWAIEWVFFVLFALFLVAGLATIGYMLWRVLTSPASGADAA